jgi:Protein of unknown function (DUF726)
MSVLFGMSYYSWNMMSKFLIAMDNAKRSGQLIGIALALGIIFPNQTVSLAGFSLGSEVVKSCLETLYECKATHIVHQIAFLAGATHFNAKE